MQQIIKNLAKAIHYSITKIEGLSKQPAVAAAWQNKTERGAFEAEGAFALLADPIYPGF